MKKLRIGINGNLPQPYGGVATTCFHLTSQFLANGHSVYFYDRTAHYEKHRPDGLTDYTQTAMRKNIAILLAELLWLALREKRFAALLFHFFQEALHLKLFRTNLKTTFRMLLTLLEMRKYFAGKQIDILYSQHALHESFAGLLLARHYFHCPFVVTVYASEFTMDANRVWLPMAVQICNQADAVVCISEYTRQRMLQAGATPKYASVFYLGADPVHFTPSNSDDMTAVSHRFGIVDSSPIILYTGWLIERKGPQILLEALSKVQHQPWQAIFVGPDHGLKKTLTEQVKLLQMQDRIVISGEIPYAELLALYELAYAFVFPTLSRDEGFGLVALEAMAHGLPVIASRTGAIPEVVRENETGLFFPPGDAVILAAQLQQVLNDENLRDQLGSAARKWAMQFSWEKSAVQVMQVFETAITYHNAETI